MGDPPPEGNPKETPVQLFTRALAETCRVAFLDLLRESIFGPKPNATPPKSVPPRKKQPERKRPPRKPLPKKAPQSVAAKPSASPTRDSDNATFLPDGSALVHSQAARREQLLRDAARGNATSVAPLNDSLKGNPMHALAAWYARQKPVVKTSVTIGVVGLTVACGLLPAIFPMAWVKAVFGVSYLVTASSVLIVLWEAITRKGTRFAVTLSAAVMFALVAYASWKFSIKPVESGAGKAATVNSDRKVAAVGPSVVVYRGFTYLYEENAERLGLPTSNVRRWFPVYQAFHDKGEVISPHVRSGEVPPIIFIPQSSPNWIKETDNASLLKYNTPGAIFGAYRRAHLAPPANFAIPVEGIAGLLLDPHLRDAIGYLEIVDGLTNDCWVSKRVSVRAQRFQKGFIVGPLYVETNQKVVRDKVFFDNGSYSLGHEYNVAVSCKRWHKANDVVPQPLDY